MVFPKHVQDARDAEKASRQKVLKAAKIETTSQKLTLVLAMAAEMFERVSDEANAKNSPELHAHCFKLGMAMYEVSDLIGALKAHESGQCENCGESHDDDEDFV